MVARLTITGLIVGHAKQPPPNVFLVPTRGQMTLEVHKSVLYHILRIVAGKTETDEVAQQRLA